jgi:hypothetical protein
LEALKSR